MPSAPIPLSALRAKPGKLIVTLDIAALDPMSFVLDTSDIERLVTGVDDEVKASNGSRHDEKTHVFVRHALVDTMRNGDESSKQGAILSVLWLALNHPHHSAEMRRGMSDALRRDGRAHLTATMDSRRNWAFVLSDGYAETSRLLAAVPSDELVSLVYSRNDAKPAFQ